MKLVDVTVNVIQEDIDLGKRMLNVYQSDPSTRGTEGRSIYCFPTWFASRRALLDMGQLVTTQTHDSMIPCIERYVSEADLDYCNVIACTQGNDGMCMRWVSGSENGWDKDLNADEELASPGEYVRNVKLKRYRETGDLQPFSYVVRIRARAFPDKESVETSEEEMEQYRADQERRQSKFAEDNRRLEAIGWYDLPLEERTTELYNRIVRNPIVV